MTSRLIVDLFLEKTDQYPDSSALILENGMTLSYSQLKMKAVEIGGIILNIISEEDIDGDTMPVCVMMNRNSALISAILGILLAGAAYVPVDPSFPPDRQSYIFSHSKCKLLLVDEESYAQALLLGVDLPPVVVLTPDATIKSSPRPYNTSAIDTETVLKTVRADCSARSGGGLMYILYTSGSTGKPKGVMVTQYGVTNIVTWFAKEIGVSNMSRVLGLTTACFDISVLEIFMPLVSGATLVLAESATQKDPFRLLEVMAEHKVDVVQATPTTYEMLLATGWEGDRNTDFLVGGEAFRPSLIPLSRACRSFRNVYGPTETTIWSSCYQLTQTYFDSLPVNSTPVIPVGKPISETVFYLLDTSSEGGLLRQVDAAAGEEGELCIGGVGVARGYLHAHDLTAKVFIPNPFGEGIIYRTGDLVRMSAGGDYIFVRRLDDQVKVDGFRIELAEIENVYGSHPLVDQAVVIVRMGKLSAYLKIKGEKALSVKELEDIRDFASRSLMYYMLPTFTTIVPEFPHTANGKLDRKALPDPVVATLDAAGDDFDKSLDDHTMLSHIRLLMRYGIFGN
jgi:amino acid adenylation domain-containing protein